MISLRNPWGLRDQENQPLDREVLVGENRLPMRLLTVPVPPEVLAQRRKQLIRAAQKQGRAANHEQMLLCAWRLSLTDVPSALFSLPEVLVLLRLRGPLELLIKLFKEQGKVDEWRRPLPMRILCELWAKLIGLLIQHWLLLVSCWQESHRSLVKAAKAVRSHAIMLAYGLVEAMRVAVCLASFSSTPLSTARASIRARSSPIRANWCWLAPMGACRNLGTAEGRASEDKPPLGSPRLVLPSTKPKPPPLPVLRLWLASGHSTSS